MARKRPPRKDYKLSAITAEIPRACQDDAAAVEFLERMRWGTESGELEVACPHCGVIGESYAMKDRKTGERNKRFLWRDRACGKQFSVKVGSIMEDSAIAPRHWCFAFWRIAAGKKGCAAMEIHRMTGVSYRSSLFMLHRIRAAMAVSSDDPKLSGVIEADEVYLGGVPRKAAKGRSRKSVWSTKQPVLTVVQRDGSARALHVPRANADEVKRFLRANVDTAASKLNTDESKPYWAIGQEFGEGHSTVFHGEREYARGDVSTNAVEGFHGLLWRQLYGTHHAVSAKHLQAYVDEAAWKYSTRKLDDGDRVKAAVQAADGRRLTYREHVQKRRRTR